jgi:hypothetical protein
MNATIRAHHLGLAVPTETARQFQRKVLLSLTIVSLATASMVYESMNFPIHHSKTAKTIRVKANRAKRRILDLFEA